MVLRISPLATATQVNLTRSQIQAMVLRISPPATATQVNLARKEAKKEIKMARRRAMMAAHRRPAVTVSSQRRMTTRPGNQC
jgi:hypothetical protein